VSLLGVTLGAVLFAVAVWPRSGVTRWNVKKVDFGMTEKEVEACLGGPGLTDPKRVAIGVDWIRQESASRPLPPGCTRKAWIGPDCGIVMSFDSRGIVSKDAGEILRIMLRGANWGERMLDRIGIARWP
jgi:hypothetical protein